MILPVVLGLEEVVEDDDLCLTLESDTCDREVYGLPCI